MLASDMHILILGASGQIGSPTLLQLARDFPTAMITGTSRREKVPDQYLGSNLRFRAFDPFQSDWAELGQVDVLINCIGQIKESPACSFEMIHTGITRLMLQHRETLGNPRIIQVSALGAGQHPQVPFLATKHAADQLLLAAGEAHIIRPSIVCSPDTMLVRKIRQLYRIGKQLGGNLLVPEGFMEARIQPILVADVAALISAIVSQADVPTVIPAVGPHKIAFGELVELIGTVRGKSLRLLTFPRLVAAFFVRYFIAPLFPTLITWDQFQLLFEDNIGSQHPIQNALGCMPTDTLPFWKQQFEEEMAEK